LHADFLRMRIERHVYGSVSGYETLASSPGLSSAELRALENVSVGQISDPSFLRSLEKTPACVLRSLGGRTALTRVFPGPPDDQGRATIRRVSIVLSREDWDGGLRGDLGPLVACRELWQWDGRRDLPTIDVNLAPPSLPAAAGAQTGKLLDLLSLIERGQITGRPVIIRETHLGSEELRLLELLIPPAARASHSAAYRAVRADLPANLIVLAEQAPVSASAESYRPGLTVERSPYATALAGAGFGRDHIPLDFIRSYRSFAMPSRAATPRAPANSPSLQMGPQVIIEQMPRGVLIAFIAACILLPILSGVSAYHFTRRHEQAAKRVQLAGFLTELTEVQPPVLVAKDRTKLLEIYGRIATASSSDLEKFKARVAAMDQAEKTFLAGLGGPNPPDFDMQPQPFGYGEIKKIIAKVSCDPNQPQRQIEEKQRDVARAILGAAEDELKSSVAHMKNLGNLTPADVLDRMASGLNTLNLTAAQWLPDKLEVDLKELKEMQDAERRAAIARLATPVTTAPATVRSPETAPAAATNAAASPRPAPSDAGVDPRLEHIPPMLKDISKELQSRSDSIASEIKSLKAELDTSRNSKGIGRSNPSQQSSGGKDKTPQKTEAELSDELDTISKRKLAIQAQRQALQGAQKQFEDALVDKKAVLIGAALKRLEDVLRQTEIGTIANSSDALILVRDLQKDFEPQLRGRR
jgi:hypothetical protein